MSEVRLLTNAEKSEADALVREVFVEEEGMGLNYEAAVSFTQFLKNHGDELSYIGVFDPELCGILGFVSDIMHISLLFVRQAKRKHGYAKAMFKTLRVLAGEKKIQRITLNALDSAIAVYEALGFEKAGDKTKAAGMSYTMMEYLLGNENLGKRVKVIIDKPYGSQHPFNDTEYTVNAGYIESDLSGDNDFQEAYVYGPEEALDIFTGTVIGIVYHRDMNETVWIVARDEYYDKKKVIEAIGSIEQYYETRIEWYR